MNNLEKTTNLQNLASNPKNSVWVFASAGSGKTKILVDRVLRLLLNQTNPDKILCLTFTKVAATEMQHRITQELSNWILLDDQSLKQKLTQLTGNTPTNALIKDARSLFLKILDAESKIKIQTIHSFCQNLVKIFPFEAQIKPSFEVMDDIQEKLLIKKAQKILFQNAQTDENLKNSVRTINAQLHEDSFVELVSNLLNKKEQLLSLKEECFDLDGVIEKISKFLAIDKNLTNNEIFQEFFTQINQDEVKLLAQNLEQSALKKNIEASQLITQFLNQPTLENFTLYKEAFFTKSGSIKKLPGKVLDDATNSQTFHQQIELISEFNDNLNSHKIFNSTALLLKFIYQILEIYSGLKNQLCLLDYNDLIIQTNKLLENPEFSEWVKLKMDGLFDHILIDESQDTNHQQWNIIKALTDDFFSGLSASNDNRTIFIVGDEKQSIYSFQGAEPNISQDIFSYFEQKLQNHPSKLLKVNLDSSFRSLKTILQAVDKTFAKEEQQSAITKISKFQGHNAIKPGIGKVEIWPQVKTKKPKEQKNYEWQIDFTPQDIYQEQEFYCEYIALKIQSMVENSYMLEGKNRPVQYGDFMILLRNKTNGFDRNLTRFFQKYNIPSISPARLKFADHIIIQDLLSAAKFCLFPYDNLNLCCLLKSPIFDISEEELLEICASKKDDSIYGSLQNHTIKDQLNNIINASQKLDSFEFFNYLIKEYDLNKKTKSRFGDEGLQVLNKFTLQNFDFTQNFAKDLLSFINFIENLEPEFSLNNSSNNQVAISTIHSAKGLQSPIVIMPDCAFNFNRLPATKDKISWINFYDQKLPIWCPKKENQNQILQKYAHEKLKAVSDESLRLLYVAMTRAENELYIGGVGSSHDENSWYSLVKDSLKNEGWDKEFKQDFAKDLEYENFDFENQIIAIGKKEEEFCSKPKAEETTDNKIPAIKSNAKIDKIYATKPRINQIDESQIKGKLIHKILEIIGNKYQSDHKWEENDHIWVKNLSNKLIQKEQFLSKETKSQIKDLIAEFLTSNKFGEIFSDNIKCEMPISGTINNETINARIDLLKIADKTITIIDYKTDKTIPNSIPQSYVNQLNTYETLVKNHYPDHKISSKILWVQNLKVDVV